MIVIHDVNDSAIPRVVAATLAERLRVMPVVVVTGTRQTGKSTLVRNFSATPRLYRTLDDLDVAEIAQREPELLVGGDQALIIDEIQRAPALLRAIKRAVDVRRKPGRFLLTGSANLARMKEVSESLAGRASYLTLWPMTRREQAGLGRCGLWDALLEAPDAMWPAILGAEAEAPEDWRQADRRGGFPTPALHLRTARERAIWFDGYVRTYLERDLQVLSSIAALPDFRRLMRAAALRLGQLVNQTELGRDVAMPQPTVHRYLNLMETSYLLVRLPAYAVNRTKRLIKTTKLYWGDVGLARFLAGDDVEPSGAHLENLVLQDLLVWRDARLDAAEICYWRTSNGEEVDLVVEAGGRLLPIEIKATGRPRLTDAVHLRTFRAEYGSTCRPGLLLHSGSTIEWLAPDVLAVPWWRVI